MRCDRNANIIECWGSTYREKMVKTLQLKWFGHVERRTVDSVVRKVDQMEGSEIARFRGKPRKT